MTGYHGAQVTRSELFDPRKGFRPIIILCNTFRHPIPLPSCYGVVITSMPFRAKVKRAFGKTNEDSTENGSDLSQVQSKASAKKAKKQKVEYPENVYKPGEIPESKYKGPYNKEHQQNLHAFSFKTAFQGRRKSEQSLYSPMGSRLPSRMGSFMSRRSLGARSRQQSRVGDTLAENNEGDDAVENVGMSRQHTKEDVPRPRTREEARPRTRESDKSNGRAEPGAQGGYMTNGIQDSPNIQKIQVNGIGPNQNKDSSNMDGLEPTKTVTNGSFGQPFSADDLVHAMTQSTLRPSAVQA
ncbi:MAG: hypothetical protein Q9220_000908 [cf. Caloplaca sp. 1 TL-2023]